MTERRPTTERVVTVASPDVEVARFRTAASLPSAASGPNRHATPRGDAQVPQPPEPHLPETHLSEPRRPGPGVPTEPGAAPTDWVPDAPPTFAPARTSTFTALLTPPRRGGVRRSEADGAGAPAANLLGSCRCLR
ncbi:hypothetical protein FTX61_14395 [Nitriliruptoraceae bacterium ZYF776]|nr:hypothetical protein [Profundirhabdus halotolerans]